MTAKLIEREMHGPIAVLRMQRGKGNALDIELLEAFDRVLDEVEQSPARAVVLTGEGRSFSAGVDLSAVTQGGAAYLAKFLPVLSQSLRRLVTIPRPLVAAVNGHAIAGGCIIMLAADYRLVAEGTARFGLTELLVGVPFPAWPFEIARASIPPQHFASLVLTGRLLSPGEARAHGLCDELVAPTQLLERAMVVAEQLAAVPAAAFALTKRHLRQPLVDAAEQRAKTDDSKVEAIWSSPETLAHIAQFVERTIGRK